MAITFSNISYDNVIDSLNTIISAEFHIPVKYDGHTGNQSFLLTPEDDSLDHQMPGMQVREHSVGISYQLKTGGTYTRKNLEQVSKITERLKKLLYNNRNYFVSGANKFYNGSVESVEYERDEDEPTILNSTTTFNCLTRELT